MPNQCVLLRWWWTHAIISFFFFKIRLVWWEFWGPMGHLKKYLAWPIHPIQLLKEPSWKYRHKNCLIKLHVLPLYNFQKLEVLFCRGAFPFNRCIYFQIKIWESMFIITQWCNLPIWVHWKQIRIYLKYIFQPSVTA